MAGGGRKRERKTRLSGPRISPRWSFVRREIHSAFTYRRTSAIVNSLNKLFQLQEQRRCNVERATRNGEIGVSEEFSIVPGRKWKSRGLSTHWDMKFEPFAFLLSRLARLPFRTIVQLISITFHPGETSVIYKRFPPWKTRYGFNQEVRTILRMLIPRNHAFGKRMHNFETLM